MQTACHKRRQGEQKAAADKAFGQFLYDTDDGILSAGMPTAAAAAWP